MKTPALVATLLLASSQAYADTNQDLAACAAIKGDAERLVCFDDITKKLKLDSPKSTTNQSSNWHVTTDISPVDDSKTVTLVSLAEEPFETRRGSSLAGLLIRCQENKTELFINWDTYVTLRSAPVLTRVDKDKAKTSTWGMSTNNQSTFAPRPIGLIKSMFGKETLLAQVTPHSENPVMASFNISGLEEAIKPLRKACNW